MKKEKIAVVGSGYVGMSLSVLLAQHNDVTVLDLDIERINKINKSESTIADSEITNFLKEKTLSLKATLNKEEAYKDASFIFIATPTDYDENSNSFNTDAVDSVIRDAININQNALIVIKSTIPVGHTAALQRKFSTQRIVFSPEFLREGRALKDNLYPSRIIIGGDCKKSKVLANLLKQAAKKENINCLFIGSSEAEAVKLFSNAYLAMRVAYFNEIDTYAESLNLDSSNIIDGVGLDPRIGTHYNNPSFGYGGYCLPKDTKQLLSNYSEIPQKIIRAIVESNNTRKEFISRQIIKLSPKIVGIYSLTMKSGSDNFKSSAIQDIMHELKRNNIKVVIYEPQFKEPMFQDFEVIPNLKTFKEISDIIIANRQSQDLNSVKDKIYTRDLYGTDS